MISSLLGHHAFHGDIGGFGHDISLHFDHDASGGDHGTDQATFNPLNIRNIFAFLALFGLMGLFTTSRGVVPLTTLLFSIPSGIAAAAISWGTLILMVSRQATSQATARDFVRSVGKVSLSIPTKGLGEVSLVVKGQVMSVLASSYLGDPIEKGTEVIVIEYQEKGGVAQVSTR